jgi:hypothetical protein
MPKKMVSVISVVILSLGLLSCQSAEERASQAREQAEKAEAAKQEAERVKKEMEFKEGLKSYPPLYKVTWKICNINHNPKIPQNRPCDETKEPATLGYSKPVYLWGPAGEIKMLKGRSWFTSESYLFVKSRGCLSSGEPKKEEFFKIKTFVRGQYVKDSTLPEPDVNVKIQLLSPEEKEEAVKVQNTIAKLERAGGFYVDDDYDCQTLTDWNRRV